MYSTDQEKYKSNAELQLPIPMPLYDQMIKGEVEELLKAFNQRKETLLKKIRAGGEQERFKRWQASVDALEAACVFLEQYKK